MNGASDTFGRYFRVIQAAIALEKYLAANIPLGDWPALLLNDRSKSAELGGLLTEMCQRVNMLPATIPGQKRTGYNDPNETTDEIRMDRACLQLEVEDFSAALTMLFNSVVQLDASENGAEEIDKQIDAAMAHARTLINTVHETGTVPSVWNDQTLRAHILAMWEAQEAAEARAEESQGPKQKPPPGAGPLASGLGSA